MKMTKYKKKTYALFHVKYKGNEKLSKENRTSSKVIQIPFRINFLSFLVRDIFQQNRRERERERGREREREREREEIYF